MPEALWFGLTFGVFTAAFFLALGYIYGDAKRRQKPAWAWVIATFLIPKYRTHHSWRSHKTEDGMKRERTLQVVLLLVGLLY